MRLLAVLAPQPVTPGGRRSFRICTGPVQASAARPGPDPAEALRVIKIHAAGPRRHLQPLAYPALASLFTGTLDLVAEQAAADIIVFAHPRDLHNARSEMSGLLAARPQTRIVLLSEEPFWDTVGMIAPFQRYQSLKTPQGPLPFTFLNHHTSRLYDFAQIPYFLLTEPHFIARYAVRFRRNRGWSAADWALHFAETPLQAAFMAERRVSESLDVRFDQWDIAGLSLWRTQLAEAYRPAPFQPGAVLRAGKGWAEGSADRLALEDWHLDKLTVLDRKSRFVSAVENTHQSNYVSEKIFDAFAVGAVPLYFAAPGHHIHRILPAGWLNLYGTTPQEACQRINELAFDDRFLREYAAIQATLADRFTTPALLAAERERLRGAVLAELHSVLETDPATLV